VNKFSDCLIKGGAILSLVISTFSYGHFNVSDELGEQFGEFGGNVVFDELDSRPIGVDNLAVVKIVNSAGSSASIDQRHRGRGANRAMIIQKNANQSTAGIVQRGANNTALIEQSDGTGNTAFLLQAGSGHKGYIVQSGNENEAYLIQCRLTILGCRGTRNSSEIGIVQTGNNNIAAVLDSGRSSYNITQSGGDRIYIKSNMNRGIQVRQ
jgi:hypothetical protein